MGAGFPGSAGLERDLALLQTNVGATRCCPTKNSLGLKNVSLSNIWISFVFVDTDSEAVTHLLSTGPVPGL